MDAIETENRLAKIENDLGWIKLIGGSIVAILLAGFGYLIPLIIELNGQIGALQ